METMISLQEEYQKQGMTEEEAKALAIEKMQEWEQKNPNKKLN